MYVLSDKVKMSLLRLERTDDVSRLPELEKDTIRVLKGQRISIIDDLLNKAQFASGELIRMPDIKMTEMERLQVYCAFLQDVTD